MQPLTRAAGWSATAMLATAAGLVAMPAAAAVRQCGRVIIATGQDPGSEAAARRNALVQWQADAARRGPQWTGWSIAINKKIVCRRPANGAYECFASALPCTIVQNPNRLPSPPSPPPSPPSPVQPPAKGTAI